VVALALALAFAIASGLRPSVGLVTAIVAGLVAGVFGPPGVWTDRGLGSRPPSVGGEVRPWMGGHHRSAGRRAGPAGRDRTDRPCGAYVPWPVVDECAVGIAVIIFLQQVPTALGVPKPAGTGIAVVAWRSLVRWVGIPGFEWLVLVTVVAVAMVGLPHLHRALPASLIGVVAATVVAGAAGWKVARIGTLPSSLPIPSLPPLGCVPELVSAAIDLAVLAAIESLLSAKVADALTDGPPSDPNRELVGQGLTSVASPVFGGMPSTGAIARTAVNARSGEHTRLSAIVHSLVLLGVVLAAGSLVARIPVAALAGVLMLTAVRMVGPAVPTRTGRSTRSGAAILVLTAVATVAVNLIVVIEIGLAVAGALALLHLARSAAFMSERLSNDDGGSELRRATDGYVLVYRIDGPLFFAVSQWFLEEFASIGDARVVILRLADVPGMDASAAHVFDDLPAAVGHAPAPRRPVAGPRRRLTGLCSWASRLRLVASDHYLKPLSQTTISDRCRSGVHALAQLGQETLDGHPDLLGGVPIPHGNGVVLQRVEVHRHTPRRPHFVLPTVALADGLGSVIVAHEVGLQ
jgi:SulP family sulfate permease